MESQAINFNYLRLRSENMKENMQKGESNSKHRKPSYIPAKMMGPSK